MFLETGLKKLCFISFGITVVILAIIGILFGLKIIKIENFDQFDSKTDQNDKNPEPIRRSDSIFIPSNHPNYGKFATKKCSTNYRRFETRINGGQDTNYKNNPFIARLVFKNDTHESVFCGGSLIADDYVLTAAHCFDETEHFTKTSVQVGDIEDLLTISNIEIKIHKEYDPRRNWNDIALIKLNPPVEFTETIDIICLPLNDAEIPNEMTLIGFKNLSIVSSIAEGKFEVLDTDECYNEHDAAVKENNANKKARFITDSQFCTKNTGLDSTPGDSGMPIIEFKKYTDAATIHGLVSYGSKNKTLPVVYTKIQSHLKWIMDETEIVNE